MIVVFVLLYAALGIVAAGRLQFLFALDPLEHLKSWDERAASWVIQCFAIALWPILLPAVWVERDFGHAASVPEMPRDPLLDARIRAVRSRLPKILTMDEFRYTGTGLSWRDRSILRKAMDEHGYVVNAGRGPDGLPQIVTFEQAERLVEQDFRIRSFTPLAEGV